MSVKTNNIYGKIIITDKTIEKFISHIVGDCYGIAGFVPSNIYDVLFGVFTMGSSTRGVKVRSSGDRIFIDLSVLVCYGMNIKAVIDSLKEAVQYKVERFTGMIVDTINVDVKGITQ